MKKFLKYLNPYRRKIYHYEITKSNITLKKIIAYSTLTLAVFAFITAVFAISTYLSQSNYYKKITRPFIFVENISVVPVNIDSTLWRIRYTMKNVGNMPAKNFRSGSLLWKNDKEIPNVCFDESIYTMFFPTENKYVDYGPPRSLKNIQQALTDSSYFHIFIKYTGIDDKPFKYKSVSLCYSSIFKFVSIRDEDKF